MKKLGIYWMIVGVLGFVTISCDDEDDDPTIAQVLVETVDKKIVPGANVTLVCESSQNKECNILIEGVSDENGVFETRRDLSQILRVSSYKIVNDTEVVGVPPDTTLVITRDSICGETFINIIENETSRQTVVLYSCN